jgi:hypothetical protein
MGSLLLILGIIISLVGGIWLLVLAFQESVLWGIGSIIVPFVSLIFVFMHWTEAWRPFVLSVVGSVLAMIGAMMMQPAIG